MGGGFRLSQNYATLLEAGMDPAGTEPHVSMKNHTTGSVYLEAIAATFASISYAVTEEFFDYPVYRKLARDAGALNRYFREAAETFRSGAPLDTATLLTDIMNHAFFYREGLARPEFRAFTDVVSGVIKALREEQDQLVVWGYMGVAFGELAHAVPRHMSTYPGYSI